MSDFKEQYNKYLSLINGELEKLFSDYKDAGIEGLVDSMLYSLNAGGKRIRPILVLEFCRFLGGDHMQAIPIALSVELMHTYSLIHDDLPCMDDDDFRRGKPTNHKKYGETTAVLAGDSLQAEAFCMILGSAMPTERRARCSEILANAVGAKGICGGQYIDTVLDGENLSSGLLFEKTMKKTAALIKAACMMGAAAAGACENVIHRAGVFGENLGMAFQIRDDVLDEIGSIEKLGKSAGSDVKAEKTTFLTVYGKERCEELVKEHTERAKREIEGLGDTGFLFELAESLVNREN